MRASLRRIHGSRLAVSGIALGSALLLASAASAHESLSVGKASADQGQEANVPLTVSSDDPVQGFVLVFEWDGDEAEGVDLTPAEGSGKALQGADLVVKRVEDDFMVFSVVMDTDGKDQEKIPAGDNTPIGTARLRCKGSTTTVLRLVDDKYAMVDGGPTLSNLISVGGRSIREEDGLELSDGALTCGEGEPAGEITFTCGGNLKSDGNPSNARGSIGERAEVNFYYKDPGSGSGPRDRIQGLSMALTFDCDLFADDDIDDSDGVLDDVNAEFIHVSVDNNNSTGDGDGCELTVGVLVDAKSPFDGRTLPATNEYERLFSVHFGIEEDAPCGDCLDIKFKDGLNGGGKTPVKNLVSINFNSQKPDLKNCRLCVEGESHFVRGNCNFSEGRDPVDISDAAAMVGYIFLDGEWKFSAPCKDACDANDDGRLDAGDIVFVLNYLFVPGKKKPPAPGPNTAGPDPTGDSLDCDVDSNDC
jgi:hypothetical protein